MNEESGASTEEEVIGKRESEIEKLARGEKQS